MSLKLERPLLGQRADIPICSLEIEKASDTRSKGFGDISVELDAIEPDMLRGLVQSTIEHHLPPEQFEVLKAAEESERKANAAFLSGGAAG